MSYEEYLVILNVPLLIEEAMVDCLLTFEAEHGFSRFDIFAHDHKNQGLSLTEQVTGRQKKIRFEMSVRQTDLAALLEKLSKNFQHAGIQYWVLPILDKGVI